MSAQVQPSEPTHNEYKSDGSFGSARNKRRKSKPNVPPQILNSNDPIRCSDVGTMSDDHRHLVLNTFRYCRAHNAMDVSNIRDRLKHQGMKTVVIHGSNTFAHSNGIERMTWSKWSTQNGKYTIIMIQYRPTNSNEIICTNKGNMGDKERNDVLNVLRYCYSHQTMKPEDIYMVLSRAPYSKYNAVVMKDNGSGFGFTGRQTNTTYTTGTWSEWRSSKYGKYSFAFIRQN
eukprot:211743_1